MKTKLKEIVGLKGLIILFSILSVGSTKAQTTYYLDETGTNELSAEVATNWWTGLNGTGTQQSTWGTSVANTRNYIIPSGVNASLSGNLSLTGKTTVGNATTTITINGTLTIPSSNSIVMAGSSSVYAVVIASGGSVNFESTNTNQWLESDANSATFTVSSGGTLITANTNGIIGAGNHSIANGVSSSIITGTFNTAGNYTFSSGGTTTVGLPATVNNLSLTNSTGTVALTQNTTVNGTLTISSGSTMSMANNRLIIGTSGSFNHANGTLSFTSGVFEIRGAYTHSSGIFNISNGSVSVGANGTLALNSGVFNMLGRTIAIAGTVTRTSGSIHFTANAGTVNFTNLAARTLPSNMFLRYPENFTINGRGGITLGGNTRDSATDSLGVLTINDGTLTLTSGKTAIRSILGTRSIIGNTTCTILFYGSSTSTLRTSQTVPGTSNAVKNLLLTGSSNVTLGIALRIAPNGLLSIPTGTSFNTAGFLTIVSNATGHGRIGTVGGTFTSSSADSIQLFIPGGTRGYRLFGNPFTSALAVSQFMNSSTEIDITGTGGSVNGFTNTTNNNPSAYSYNTSGNRWDAFTNTSQTIGIGSGAHILVRGYKGQGLNGSIYTPSAATIRLSGQFRTGNVTTSLSDSGFGWNLVGNPYPSNIDIDQISGGNWSNVNAAIYGYDKVNRTYSAYTKGSPSSSVNNLSNIIEMGSSFLVEVNAAGAASITFTEAIKTSASSTVSGNPIFTPKAERLNQFKINISGAVGTEGVFHDECLLSFGNTSISTPEFDPQSDAWDLGGEMLNVSIITPKNDYLAINEYPSIEKQTEAIPLNVWSKNNGEYSLSFTEVSPIIENTEICLRDKYKNVVHFIQESPYKFTINDIKESYGANRFELFAVQQRSGLSKTSPKNTLQVFPNPVDMNTSKVSIYIPGEGHEYVQTTIYELSGREVYSSKKVKYETMQIIDIPLPTKLSAQTYLMSCETHQGKFVQQIIIINDK